MSILDSNTLGTITAKRKLHNMPITGVVFKEGEKMIITAGLDYRYCIVKQYPD